MEGRSGDGAALFRGNLPTPGACGAFGNSQSGKPVYEGGDFDGALRTMTRLGRWIALPLMLAALALAGLAPGAAAAMPLNLGGGAICSAHHPAGGPGRGDPARDHDCCAAACALAGLGAAPPTAPEVQPAALGDSIEPRLALSLVASLPAPAHAFQATGPPTSASSIV
jgi:hypothetical protein